jgi:hypothetical protein
MPLFETGLQDFQDEQDSVTTRLMGRPGLPQESDSGKSSTQNVRLSQAQGAQVVVPTGAAISKSPTS